MRNYSRVVTIRTREEKQITHDDDDRFCWFVSSHARRRRRRRRRVAAGGNFFTFLWQPIQLLLIIIHHQLPSAGLQRYCLSVCLSVFERPTDGTSKAATFGRQPRWQLTSIILAVAETMPAPTAEQLKRLPLSRCTHFTCAFSFCCERARRLKMVRVCPRGLLLLLPLVVLVPLDLGH